MTTPFYVSPEQLMKDRADFARKGIGRGRSLVVVQYVDGIVFVSENLSQALHKVSEIYDRIAFAAVGRYNEFENLRIAGVRLADMRGYAYDRADVTGRGLANAYAQTLGTIFSSGGEKPYEVEIFVAEVGQTPEGDSIYRLTYDGQVADEHGFAVMGGTTELATAHLKEHYRPGASLEDAIRVAVQALGRSGAAGNGQPATESRTVPAGNLEVAVLDRTRSQQRKFKRLLAGQLSRILGGDAAVEAEPTPGQGTPPGTGPVTPAAEAAEAAGEPDTGAADEPVAPPPPTTEEPAVAPAPATTAPTTDEPAGTPGEEPAAGGGPDDDEPDDAPVAPPLS